MAAINWWSTVQLTKGRPGRPVTMLRQLAKADRQAPEIAASLTEHFGRQVTPAGVRKAAARAGITLKRGRPHA